MTDKIKSKTQHMHNKEIPCQACRDAKARFTLIHDVEYKVCYDCLAMLVIRILRPIQWKNLVEIHGNIPYLLHEDFYDESGKAIQPFE